MLAAAAAWLDADPCPRLAHVPPLVATVRLAPEEAAAKVQTHALRFVGTAVLRSCTQVAAETFTEAARVLPVSSSASDPGPSVL